MSSTKPFWIGEWFVDPSTGRISRQGAELKLEPKVMSVLVYLAQHPGEVISRETLEGAIWPNVVVSYDALSGTIIKLRKALGDNSRSPRYIETISKKGYRLLATVSATSANREKKPSPSQESIFPSRLKKSIYLVAGITLVLVVAISYFYYHEADRTLVISRPSANPSLAVLPFVNIHEDPEQEYFSDGITDDLIIDLSRYSNLRVVSRRSVYIYKGRHADIQTIANELGVDYLVDGNIRRDGQKIRINIQLVDAATGLNVWAQRFEEHSRNIFEVQDRIRQSILDRLAVSITKEERKRAQRKYTTSFESYDLFLQGQSKLVTRASAQDNQAAQELLEEAIARDPNFSRAQAALALTYADAYRFDWTDNPEQTRQLALTKGQLAVDLDPHSNQAHWILGYILLFCYEQHDKALEMAKIATKIAPQDNDGFNLLAVTYSMGGQPEKAKLIIQEIMKKNSRYSSMVPGVLGHANLFMGKYVEALTAYDESLTINPSRINSNVYKVIVLYRMGKIDDAMFQADQLTIMHPDFDAKIWAARQPIKDKELVKAMIADLAKVGIGATE